MTFEVHNISKNLSSRKSTVKCQTVRLTLYFLITVTLIITLLIAFYKGNLNKSKDLFHSEALQISESSAQHMCSTPNCLKAASRILNSIDSSVDPCDDFYQFSCGNFLKQDTMLGAKESVSSSSIAFHMLKERLRRIMEEPIPPNEPKSFLLLKQMYKSCINTTAIERDGLTTIKSILRDVGGWPVLEGQNWNSEDFNWTRSIYKLKKYGYTSNYFISVSVKPTPTDNPHYVLYVSQPDLPLMEKLFNTNISMPLHSRLEYMVDVAVIFGANREVAKQELSESLEFEYNLTMVENTDHDWMLMVSQLQTQVSSITWLEYFNSIFNHTGVTIKNFDFVIVTNSYIWNFEKLLLNTPKRILANYLMWRVVAASIPYLTDELRQRELEYNKIYSETRWKKCVIKASESFQSVTAALYSRRYFRGIAKQNVKDLVSNVGKEFIALLKRANWTVNNTIEHALEEAAAVTSHFGYPENFLSDEKLDELYKGLNFTSDNYLKMILRLNLHTFERSAKRLRQAVGKRRWITPSLSSEKELPVGILQGAFLSGDGPQSINYGAISYLIGHDITRGYDSEDRELDRGLYIVDWWAPTAEELVTQRVQCIIDQYANSSMPKFMDAILLQAYDVVDHVAYMAYQKWVRKNGIDQGLLGLNYTGNQLFWISAANVWCTRTGCADDTDSYSLPKLMVNLPLSGSDGFAKDFSCAKGSKMNPADKCNVWK
uniref:Peptidase M13 N-terminal domain-containing protein n=1 Tax=Photinus pyralis TaxID=7054 RepID=A0A1Y1KG01_PHOPY